MTDSSTEGKKVVLVTGGAGFIGSHLCEALQKAGHAVTSLDNYSMGSEENHIDGVTYIEGDTKDIDTHISFIPDLVFHLGEYPRVEQSFDDIEKVLESNDFLDVFRTFYKFNGICQWYEPKKPH